MAPRSVFHVLFVTRQYIRGRSVVPVTVSSFPRARPAPRRRPLRAMWLLFSACALLTPHTQPPRHTHPRPRLLPAVMVAGSGREGGGDIDVQRDPPDKLLDLVVQCAVQAQLAYHNEFKSEVRAKWLESFLGWPRESYARWARTPDQQTPGRSATHACEPCLGQASCTAGSPASTTAAGATTLGRCCVALLRSTNAATRSPRFCLG